MTVSNGPITREEMIEMFGSEAPIEAINLIWNAPDNKTLSDIRRELREIAAKQGRPQSEVRSARDLAEELREYTAMKYAGDCKCGKCQLVPRELVERIYHALNSTRPAAQALTISVKPMELSDDRTDYFVSISVGDREITPYVFCDEQFKAEYEAASFRWLLLGEPKPDLMSYSEDGWPSSVPSAHRGSGK